VAAPQAPVGCLAAPQALVGCLAAPQALVGCLEPEALTQMRRPIFPTISLHRLTSPVLSIRHARGRTEPRASVRREPVKRAPTPRTTPSVPRPTALEPSVSMANASLATATIQRFVSAAKSAMLPTTAETAPRMINATVIPSMAPAPSASPRPDNA